MAGGRIPGSDGAAVSGSRFTGGQLRPREAAAIELLSCLQACERDVARRKEQVSLREADAAALEESLADREQVSVASVDVIRGVGRDVVARVGAEVLAKGAATEAKRQQVELATQLHEAAELHEEQTVWSAEKVHYLGPSQHFRWSTSFGPSRRRTRCSPLVMRHGNWPAGMPPRSPPGMTAPPVARRRRMKLSPPEDNCIYISVALCFSFCL